MHRVHNNVIKFFFCDIDSLTSASGLDFVYRNASGLLADKL